jgi:HD-GYP domain-containing protein (c-di-GMP phosphodiesterase class II)
MKISDVFEIIDKLNRIRDIDALLEQILHEALNFTNADAGSIYLRRDNLLHFQHVENKTLSRRDPNFNRHIYQKRTVEINEKSISGHVALTGEIICIPDVYELDESLPYSFNRSFDETSNYRTKSLLTVPLIAGYHKEVVGVIQILNSINKIGQPKSFSKREIVYVNILAGNASHAIERAKLMRELVLRMNRMAEVRDPKETSSHVKRVGAYSVEIFERWAQKRNYNHEKIMKDKDILRTAAMLHDVGKVAISDRILQKPGKLTEEEYAAMKEHTIRGADFFDKVISEWDVHAAEVALRHHERWDGGGYPGNLSGENIPIFGRIVALADVFDALISKRVYKEEWTEDRVLDEIRAQSGKQFDPDVVAAFFEKYETISDIRKCFAE